MRPVEADRLAEFDEAGSADELRQHLAFAEEVHRPPRHRRAPRPSTAPSGPGWGPVDLGSAPARSRETRRRKTPSSASGADFTWAADIARSVNCSMRSPRGLPDGGGSAPRTAGGEAQKEREDRAGPDHGCDSSSCRVVGANNRTSQIQPGCHASALPFTCRAGDVFFTAFCLATGGVVAENVGRSRRMLRGCHTDAHGPIEVRRRWQ